MGGYLACSSRSWPALHGVNLDDDQVTRARNICIRTAPKIAKVKGDKAESDKLSTSWSRAFAACADRRAAAKMTPSDHRYRPGKRPGPPLRQNPPERRANSNWRRTQVVRRMRSSQLQAGTMPATRSGPHERQSLRKDFIAIQPFSTPTRVLEVAGYETWNSEKILERLGKQWDFFNKNYLITLPFPLRMFPN